MPDCFLVDNKRHHVKRRISSQALPLGIEPDTSFKGETHFIPIEIGDRVILATDGVTEARNPRGAFFGEARLIESITHQPGCDFLIDRLAEDLEAFCELAPQDDDISAVEIPVTPALLPGWDKEAPPQGSEEERLEAILASAKDDYVEFHLTLHGTQLRHADPVPILINYIQETAGLHDHRRPLFTILTELYVNALDHGILQLDSNLKQGEEGFSTYFRQREQRLHALTQGRITIGLRIHNLHRGGYMVIEVEDSGRGFDIHRLVPKEIPETQFSGRGIMLVRSLCRQLNYTLPGNKAEAIYMWSDTHQE